LACKNDRKRRGDAFIAGFTQTFHGEYSRIRAICRSGLGFFARDLLAKNIMQIAKKIFVPNLSVCGCDSIFTL
jgi:hypothetical protein